MKKQTSGLRFKNVWKTSLNKVILKTMETTQILF